MHALFQLQRQQQALKNMHMCSKVGQNRTYTPYMTVYLVTSLPKCRIYTVYIWFWPTLLMCLCGLDVLAGTPDRPTAARLQLQRLPLTGLQLQRLQLTGLQLQRLQLQRRWAYSCAPTAAAPMGQQLRSYSCSAYS